MIRKTLNLYFIAGSQNVDKDKDNLLIVLEEALKSGITCFQYREKGKDSLFEQDKEAYKLLARKCLRLCHKYNVPMIINDDVDLAVEIKADGIHVGQGDTQIEEVIDRVPKSMIVGLSTHNQEQISYANTVKDLDYIGIGPVFATATKKDHDPPLGIKRLSELASSAILPSVAIGGINQENIKEICQTDVDGVAVISAIAKAKAEKIAFVIKQLKTVSYNTEQKGTDL